MPAGLEETDSMLSVRETPWHQLGFVLDYYPSRDEAQQLAHPWEPIEAPVFRRTIWANHGLPESGFEEIEGSKIIERSDTGAALGVVNESLGIITNNEMWDVVEAVGEIGSDIKIETARSLEGGKKVWILLRLEQPLQIKGDPNGGTVAFLAFQNDHQGKGSYRAQAVNSRIVCWNTSQAADTEAHNSGYEFFFRHSKNVKDRIEDAKAAVTMWRSGIDQWQMAMEALVTRLVDPYQVKEFIVQMIPMPPDPMVSDRVKNNVITARQQVEDILLGQTCEGVSHTAYGLVQAGLEWGQHYRRTRASDDRGRMESRFKRVMLSNDRLGKDLIDLAVSL